MENPTIEQRQLLIRTLKERFIKNMFRHETLIWEDVEQQLSTKHLDTLWKMEETGGEPDVLVSSEWPSKIIYFDCASETPKNRRSCCYDEEALVSRKEHKPKFSAVEMSKEIGIELLDESDYRILQAINPVDLKTSSWLKTPKSIRELGGAIFGDRRYETVFIYHNGVESYYAARGFRGKLIL